MKKLLKFKSRRSFKQDVIITVALAVVIGSALGAFLLETPQDDTGASYDPANSTVLQGNINGIATVTDGDTIKINDTRIRFHGIDAPESGQTCIYADGRRWNCGDVSTKYLQGLVRNKSISCEQRDIDRYGRIVAVCTIVDNDINAMMVDQGMALAYRSYSNDYVDNEAAAKASSKGMWGGKFIEPWKWRTGTRLANQVDVGECNIKGNINSKGVKIYHVPSARYYTDTKINEANGERWFCTELEARQAGWRKSKV
jgi:endonuclease YncB( thermonuclease family)